MFSRHPRSVFMLRTHFIKHFFGFPPHFFVIHTLLDHNTSYLPTPFFSDLTALQTSEETAFTQIGTTGIFYRKINPFLVELKASLSQTINANTNYTLKAAGTLPADIRPAFNQTIFGSVTAASGYVGGLAKIGVATDGSLVLSGSGVSGVGVSFSDTYCLI